MSAHILSRIWSLLSTGLVLTSAKSSSTCGKTPEVTQPVQTSGSYESEASFHTVVADPLLLPQGSKDFCRSPDCCLHPAACLCRVRWGLLHLLPPTHWTLSHLCGPSPSFHWRPVSSSQEPGTYNAENKWHRQSSDSLLVANCITNL